MRELEGVDLDRLDIECTHYQPAPELLRSAAGEQPVTEIAGQPPAQEQLPGDRPARLGQRAGALQRTADRPGRAAGYIVSFRDHNEFHEPCVERMFVDIQRRCRPTKLAVYARYTRRGGLDINPFRTSWPLALPDNIRTARQ